ncbi:hypothetical protein A2U01_0034547, partial [Trifolium medium]|nr:hypothetical protein [Trifolium medium]
EEDGWSWNLKWEGVVLPADEEAFQELGDVLGDVRPQEDSEDCRKWIPDSTCLIYFSKIDWSWMLLIRMF